MPESVRVFLLSFFESVNLHRSGKALFCLAYTCMYLKRASVVREEKTGDRTAPVQKGGVNRTVTLRVNDIKLN